MCLASCQARWCAKQFGLCTFILATVWSTQAYIKYVYVVTLPFLKYCFQQIDVVKYVTIHTKRLIWYQTNCKRVLFLLMYKWPQEVVAAGVAAGLAISISVDLSLWISLTPSLALDLSRFQRLGLFFSTPLLFTCCNLSLVSVNAIKPYLSGVVGWTCSPLRFSQAGLWYFVGFAPAPHIIIAPEILPRSDGIWGSNFLSFIHTYVGWRHHTAFTPSLVS